MFLLPRYSDSNGNSRVPSPSPSVSASNQRPPRPASLTVPSLLGKDSSSLSHGSAGSLVEAVSVGGWVGARLEKVSSLVVLVTYSGVFSQRLNEPCLCTLAAFVFLMSVNPSD